MFIKGLLDLVFPPRCWICGTLTEELVCLDCLELICFIEPPLCSHCGKPTYLETDSCRECWNKGFQFSVARSLGVFNGVLRDAVHQFKYQNGRKLASFFTCLMTEKISSDFWACDQLTFVPLCREKEWERGYNQARLLAENIGRAIERPCHSTLRLIKQTKDQSKLPPDERRKNVREAFSITDGRSVKNKTVILVDDVFTTGATVNECAKVLIKGGAAEVKVATIARSINQ